MSQTITFKAFEHIPEMQNERHALWERFAKTQNERHALWERFFGVYVPDWRLQEGPPKTVQTVYFKRFWTFFGIPLEHPRSGHEKMDQRKWTPKSSHGDGAKYSFFQHILQIMLFGVHPL